MRCLIVLAVVALAGHTFAADESAHQSCKAHDKENIDQITSFLNCQDPNLQLCNSLLPGFEHTKNKVIYHSHEEIYKSYDYLLLASHFGTFAHNRPGFYKLYKDLSDKAWNNAIDLIKYVAQRGGKMTFNEDPKANRQPFNVDIKELESLEKVLDTEKRTAQLTRRIHEHASHASCPANYDPTLAHFVEEKYFEDQTDIIRKLAGYANDLKDLHKDPVTKADKQETDKSFATYLFDEYLQK